MLLTFSSCLMLTFLTFLLSLLNRIFKLMQLNVIIHFLYSLFMWQRLLAVHQHLHLSFLARELWMAMLWSVSRRDICNIDFTHFKGKSLSPDVHSSPLQQTGVLLLSHFYLRGNQCYTAKVSPLSPCPGSSFCALLLCFHAPREIIQPNKIQRMCIKPLPHAKLCTKSTRMNQTQRHSLWSEELTVWLGTKRLS